MFLTGKGLCLRGGSLIRPEATGYGNVYFAQNMLASQEEIHLLKEKQSLFLDAGNVAQYAVARKATAIRRLKLLHLSDSGQVTFMMQTELNAEKLAFVMELEKCKNVVESVNMLSQFPSAEYPCR